MRYGGKPYLGEALLATEIVPLLRQGRFRLPYVDVAALLAERGIHVDPSTIFDWVQQFTSLYQEAARSRRRRVGQRWSLDETYMGADNDSLVFGPFLVFSPSGGAKIRGHPASEPFCDEFWCLILRCEEVIPGRRRGRRRVGVSLSSRKEDSGQTFLWRTACHTLSGSNGPKTK